VDLVHCKFYHFIIKVDFQTNFSSAHKLFLLFISSFFYWNRKFGFTKPETDSNAAFTVIIDQLGRADADPEAVLSAGSSRDLIFVQLDAPGIEAGITAEWCCPHRTEVGALDELHDWSCDWIWQREWRRSLPSISSTLNVRIFRTNFLTKPKHN